MFKEKCDAALWTEGCWQSGVSLGIEMRRTSLPVLLVLSQLLFRVNNKCLLTDSSFVLRDQRKLDLFQALGEVLSGEKLRLNFQRIITLHFCRF